MNGSALVRGIVDPPPPNDGLPEIPNVGNRSAE